MHPKSVGGADPIRALRKPRNGDIPDLHELTSVKPAIDKPDLQSAKDVVEVKECCIACLDDHFRLELIYAVWQVEDLADRAEVASRCAESLGEDWWCPGNGCPPALHRPSLEIGVCGGSARPKDGALFPCRKNRDAHQPIRYLVFSADDAGLGRLVPASLLNPEVLGTAPCAMLAGAFADMK